MVILNPLANHEADTLAAALDDEEFAWLGAALRFPTVDLAVLDDHTLTEQLAAERIVCRVAGSMSGAAAGCVYELLRYETMRRIVERRAEDLVAGTEIQRHLAGGAEDNAAAQLISADSPSLPSPQTRAFPAARPHHRRISAVLEREEANRGHRQSH